MFFVTAVAGLIVAVLIARAHRLRGSRSGAIGWMSERWLADYRASRSR